MCGSSMFGIGKLLRMGCELLLNCLEILGILCFLICCPCLYCGQKRCGTVSARRSTSQQVSSPSNGQEITPRYARVVSLAEANLPRMPLPVIPIPETPFPLFSLPMELFLAIGKYVQDHTDRASFRATSHRVRDLITPEPAIRLTGTITHECYARRYLLPQTSIDHRALPDGYCQVSADRRGWTYACQLYDFNNRLMRDLTFKGGKKWAVCKGCCKIIKDSDGLAVVYTSRNDGREWSWGPVCLPCGNERTWRLNKGSIDLAGMTCA